jgi:Beta-propeller repeat
MQQKRSLFVSLGVVFVTLPSVCAQEQIWLRQFGSGANDQALALAPDGAGGTMVAGETDGNLGGPNNGFDDAFVARYDIDGNQVWLRQFGTNDFEGASAVATDDAGGVYVAGSTKGALVGPVNAGGFDVFLARYDPDGTRIWIRQFGTTEDDFASALAPDGSGGVFVGGSTRGTLSQSHGGVDAFVSHYDSSGTHIWTRQFGTSALDAVVAVTSDGAGGAYATGSTTGDIVFQSQGSTDLFVIRIDDQGFPVWTQQLGSSSGETGYAITADGFDGVTVAGSTGGTLGGPTSGGEDAFVIHYRDDGLFGWKSQFGSSATDRSRAIAPDGAGGVIIAGRTGGSLGLPNLGNDDAFVARYDGDGNQLWITQTGTNANDVAFALAMDTQGTFVVTGSTGGNLGGPLGGNNDAFIARYRAGTCYADCDTSTGFEVLDVFDFLCFQDSFVNSQPYACNCDTSTGVRCDIFDFLCFQDAFVNGCP